MTKEISRKITFLNLLMTLSIVLYHMKWYPYVTTILNSPFDEKLNNIFFNCCDMLGFVAMSFFFTVSGFLFYANLSKETPVKHSLTKIKARVFTLLVPYLIWNTVDIIFNKIEIKTFYDFVLKFFYAPGNGPLWYLLAIFIFSLFSPLLAFLSKKKIALYIFFALFFTFLFLKNNAFIPSLFTVSPDWWWYGNSFFYLPSYTIGAFIGINFGTSALKVGLPNKTIYKILSIPLSLGVLAVVLFAFMRLKVPYLLPAIYCLTPIALWLTVNNGFFTRDLPPIFNCAFFAYATHITAGYAIAPFLTTALKLTSVSPLGSMGFKILLVISVYIFSIILSLFLKLILKERVYGALTGNRLSKR